MSGIHGAGAAKHARLYHGAVYGVGEGITGSSYALPTKDHAIQTLSIGEVQQYVENFITFARQNPNLLFQVTRVGCGLAGFDDEEIAPFFAEAPSNCTFDTTWRKFLGTSKEYWGTF